MDAEAFGAEVLALQIPPSLALNDCDTNDQEQFIRAHTSAVK